MNWHIDRQLSYEPMTAMGRIQTARSESMKDLTPDADARGALLLMTWFIKGKI